MPKDPKAWLRQWMAIMLCGALIICAFIQMLAKALYAVDVEIPLWFLILAGGFLGELGISREIEKRKLK